MTTRLREERRAPARLLLTAAAAQKTLRRLADADVDGQPLQVISFIDSGDEFQIYFDAKTHLPTQVDILEDDPLEGDSSYLLRYGDWRKVGAVMMPFSFRARRSASGECPAVSPSLMMSSWNATPSCVSR